MFSKVPVQDWSTLIDTNAKGTMLCYKVGANQMIKQQKEGSLEKAHYRLICKLETSYYAVICEF